MEITKNNIVEKWNDIKHLMPKEAIDVYAEFTDPDWFTDPDFSEEVEPFLKKVNEILAKSKKDEAQKTEKVSKKAKAPKVTKDTKATTKEEPVKPAKVADLTIEVKLIADFVKLDGFKGTAADLRNKMRLLLNRLQKAILEKKIRKTSKYADDIVKMQAFLVNNLNRKVSGSVAVEIEGIERLRKIAKSETADEVVSASKAYVRLNDKTDKKDEAKSLLKRISKIIESETGNKELKAMQKPLENYLSNKSDRVEPVKRDLQGVGMDGDFDDWADEYEDEYFEDETNNYSMTAADLLNQRFEVYRFKGRFGRFFGKPSKTFRMMVYGKPGQGKSTLSLLFAKYLSEEMGLRVLYVAGEEKYGYTLQDKFRRLNIQSHTLEVAETLDVSRLSDFDVVFLDSVNYLQIEPDELNNFPKNVAFVYVFQATKNGDYKGSQQYAHDVDVLVEVDQMRAKTHKNRFAPAFLEFDVEKVEF